MIINEIHESGLFDLFKKIIDIDNYYASKGKSDQSSDMDGRVRLGDNINALLEHVSITFDMKDLTLFDLHTLSKMTPHINWKFSGYGMNVFGNNINIKEYPDINHYINESKSVVNGIDLKLYKQKNDILLPIGLKKYEANIRFQGSTILRFFDGFLEKFIYSNIKIENNKITEESEEITLQTIYRNFIDLFLNISYKSNVKSSLIEDFIINKDIYSYILYNKLSLFEATPYKISYPKGTIDFFGLDNINSASRNILELKSDFKDHQKYKERDIYFYFVCSSTIHDFLIMNLCSSVGDSSIQAFKFIDHERFDIMFSCTNYKFKIPSELEKRFGVRINLMFNHNTECRNLIMSGDKLTNINHPSNKYGLILSGQPIKYTIKVSLHDVRKLISDWENIDIDSYDGSFENNPYTNTIKNLLIISNKIRSIWKSLIDVNCEW